MTFGYFVIIKSNHLITSDAMRCDMKQNKTTTTKNRYKFIYRFSSRHFPLKKRKQIQSSASHTVKSNFTEMILFLVLFFIVVVVVPTSYFRWACNHMLAGQTVTGLHRHTLTVNMHTLFFDSNSVFYFIFFSSLELFVYCISKRRLYSSFSHQFY